MYAVEATGFPLPIEIPLWLSGQLMLRDGYPYLLLVLITWSGTAIGNLLVILLARLIGTPLLGLLSNRLGMKKQVGKVQGWIDRFGLGTVIFTRWINWGYALSLWLTGLSRIPPRRILAAALLNSAIWSFAWVLLGRILAGALRVAGLPGWFVLIPGSMLLLIMGGWRFTQKLRTREG